MSFAQEKSDLRRYFRRARQQLDKHRRICATRAAGRVLKRYIRRERRIGIYWPIGSELRLDGFIQTALQRGAKLYLPYIEKNTLRLWFTPYRADARYAERRRGKSALYIPQFSGKKIRAHNLDVLLVPLVGIDKQGFRLGQGGGYYDVSLAALRGRLQPHIVGVGFACQLCERLPHEAHDRQLDAFVCEQGIMRFQTAS